MKKVLAFCLVMGFLSVGASCNDPADRIVLDRQVGSAVGADGARVDVDDGLAVVQEVSARRVSLRAQAPGISGRIGFATPSGAPWILRLENALPDVRLRVHAQGRLLSTVEMPSQIPTEKIWEVAPAEGEIRFVVEPPDATDLSPWRFAYLSDIHHGQSPLPDILARIQADPSIRFVVCGGDLTHRGTQEELDAFLADWRASPVPLYTAAGNHDVGWGHADAWSRRMGRANFHFIFRGVHFSFLDTADSGVHPEAWKQLETWLSAGAGFVHVFIAHVPPLDPVASRNAAFSSRMQAHRLLALLARGGVGLALHGHIHSFYHERPAGIDTYISGGAIAEGEKGDGMGVHFLIVNIDPSGAESPRVDIVRIHPEGE